MAGGLGVFSRPAIADQLRSDQKRIVVFNMHGGLSQLESWDPKPGAETGGPFLAIPTSVPGIHISEPRIAKPRGSQNGRRVAPRIANGMIIAAPRPSHIAWNWDISRQPTRASHLSPGRRRRVGCSP